MVRRLPHGAIERGIEELRRQREVVLNAEACVGWIGLGSKDVPLSLFPPWVRQLLLDIRREKMKVKVKEKPPGKVDLDFAVILTAALLLFVLLDTAYCGRKGKEQWKEVGSVTSSFRP